jgi:thiamine-phosphate diphosphorylase
MSSSFIDALAGSCLYPITDKRVSGLSHAEQVARLSDRGATVIQLREKLASAKDFYAEASKALTVARERGVKIIINDRVDIALALGADGVHLGQDDLSPAAARRLLGPNAIIGFSTHNLKQASLATELPVDYVAIGPIFSTNTKAAPDPVVGLEELPLVGAAVGSLPLVAIGGITFENASSVLQRGPIACALIGDLWSHHGENANKWASFCIESASKPSA